MEVSAAPFSESGMTTGTGEFRIIHNWPKITSQVLMHRPKPYRVTHRRGVCELDERMDETFLC